jgi:hypothetical protein
MKRIGRPAFDLSLLFAANSYPTFHWRHLVRITP